MKEKAVFNWSGGKDSALALFKILQNEQYEIMCLLTSINALQQRISMHGVRVDLLEKQVNSIDLPLVKMELSEMPTMEAYDKQMSATLEGLKQKGAGAAIYGDIFLEDLKTYRENRLAELGLKGVFPLWKIPSQDLVNEFLGLGFKTIVSCVNERYLDKSFAGRVIDADFLNDLPANVDPCGENGEFHTFVFDGPIFKQPVDFKKGEMVYRKYVRDNRKDDTDAIIHTQDEPFNYGFWYCDLI